MEMENIRVSDLRRYVRSPLRATSEAAAKELFQRFEVANRLPIAHGRAHMEYLLWILKDAPSHTTVIEQASQALCRLLTKDPQATSLLLGHHSTALSGLRQRYPRIWEKVETAQRARMRELTLLLLKASDTKRQEFAQSIIEQSQEMPSSADLLQSLWSVCTTCPDVAQSTGTRQLVVTRLTAFEPSELHEMASSQLVDPELAQLAREIASKKAERADRHLAAMG